MHVQTHACPCEAGVQGWPSENHLQPGHFSMISKRSALILRWTSRAWQVSRALNQIHISSKTNVRQVCHFPFRTENICVPIRPGARWNFSGKRSWDSLIRAKASSNARRKWSIGYVTFTRLTRSCLQALQTLCWDQAAAGSFQALKGSCKKQWIASRGQNMSNEASKNRFFHSIEPSNRTIPTGNVSSIIVYILHRGT